MTKSEKIFRIDKNSFELIRRHQKGVDISFLQISLLLMATKIAVNKAARDNEIELTCQRKECSKTYTSRGALENILSERIQQVNVRYKNLKVI